MRVRRKPGISRSIFLALAECPMPPSGDRARVSTSGTLLSAIPGAWKYAKQQPRARDKQGSVRVARVND